MESLTLLLDPTTLLLGGVVLLCLLWWLSTRRPPGLPPGPGPALPLLGHLHLMPKDPRAQFWTWRRQYGDVFSLYMGGKLVVVLASYSAIREALVTFADVFSDRPAMFLTDKYSKNTGIVSSSGSTWKEQRKISLEILRQMGMGKNVLAEKIQEEITHYIRAIEDHGGEAVDLYDLTQMTISNNICYILFGRRFQYDDAAFSRQIHLIHETGQLIGNSAVLNFFPILEHLPGDVFHMKHAINNMDTMKGFLRAQMPEKAEGLASDADDFIHAYLHHIPRHQDTGDSVNEANLLTTALDLMLAGTETTASTLTWAMAFFLHHPEVQEKCYQEICDTIGPTRAPNVHDKADMTYVEATTAEVLRKANLVPLNVMHSTTDDVTFRNYVIPKGALVIPCLEMALSDPEVWGDPDNFRPERFIGLDGKTIKVDELIPFSMGRRVCLGEPLARMELFLYLTTLIQRFRFLPPEDGQLPSLEGILGIVHVPKPFKVRAVMRE